MSNGQLSNYLCPNCYHAKINEADCCTEGREVVNGFGAGPARPAASTQKELAYLCGRDVVGWLAMLVHYDG